MTGPWCDALRRKAKGKAYPLRTGTCLALIDIAEEAQALAAILATNGMGVGLLRHPPHAEVYQRLSDALAEAAKEHS